MRCVCVWDGNNFNGFFSPCGRIFHMSETQALSHWAYIFLFLWFGKAKSQAWRRPTTMACKINGHQSHNKWSALLCRMAPTRPLFLVLATPTTWMRRTLYNGPKKKRTAVKGEQAQEKRFLKSFFVFKAIFFRCTPGTWIIQECIYWGDVMEICVEWKLI